MRAEGPPTAVWLAEVSATEIAEILGQRADHELMSLYAQALRSLGRFLADGGGVLVTLGGRADANDYNTRLYRVARAILKNDSEAEDVMQDAYVRAFQHLDQFAGRAKFSTWLTRIAVHEALARGKRTLRHAREPRKIADRLRPDGDRHERVRFRGLEQHRSRGHAAELTAKQGEPRAAEILRAAGGRERMPQLVIGRELAAA